MADSFANQLTQGEIDRGVWLYIIKRQWFLFVFWFVILVPCLRVLGAGAWGAIGGAVAGTVFWTAVLFLFTRGKFSPAKTAVYRLEDAGLEIVGSDGMAFRYAYGEIKVLAADGILVLCLPKGRFAIVSMRCAGAERVRKISSNTEK